MPLQYINTGTGANKGNGDTLRLAFTKINQNFALLSNNSKDIVGEVISNTATQSGIVVSYDHATQLASFAVNIAGPNTLGAVRIGSGIALNTTTGLISVFDGNYNNLANIPQALGTTDTPTFANLHITGNIDIAGTSTIVNSTVVTTDDLTLTLANNSVSQGASNGAGIVVNGPTTPASITYNGYTDSWYSNKTFTAPNISIGGNNVVTANQLGDITFSTNTISTLNSGENLVLTPNGTGTLVLNKLDTIKVASTIYQGTAYDSVEYSDTSIRVDANTNSFAQMIMQNHNAGNNASTDLVIMNDQGDSFSNIIDLGINSSGYSQPTYGVTRPGDGYLFTNGGNLVLGTQSPNKSIIFHAGGTTTDNAGGSLTQYAWTFNRRVTVSVNSPARLDFLVQNTSNNVEASAYVEAQNDLTDFIKMGVNSSQRVDGNILQGESFIYSSAETGTLHIGNHSAINFYTNPYSGYAGTATLRLEQITGNAILDGSFLPYENEIYDLGDTTSTWRNLYLSTVSNVSFGSNQLAVNTLGDVTVNDTPILGSISISGAVITSKDTYGPLEILSNGVDRSAAIVLYPESNEIEIFGILTSGAPDAFSLGSPSNHWRGVWVGTDGIQFSDGSSILSANGLGGGNATVVVNSTGTVANTGTLWYDTVGGRLYVGYDDTFVDASPAPILDLSTITQHILPGADLTYDLGSPTNQWRSLYVGTATIYIGGIPISVNTSTNTLQVGSANTATVTNIATEAFVMGYIGSIGSVGYVGSRGNNGYTGSAGTNGYSGSNGAQGYTGSAGATGPMGLFTATGNIIGTLTNVTLVAGSYNYTFDNTGILTLPAGGANEGAEIDFTKSPNSTLSGNIVAIDQYIDRIRFFEGGGTTRGAYIDLSQAAAGVGTLLNNRVSGIVNSGTFVTMDNLKATVTTGGNRGLSLATVSGSNTYYIGGNYATSGGANGSSGSTTITTSAGTSQFNWNFTGAGDISTYILTDIANSRSYRITLQIGPSYTSNMISIERLV